MQRYKNYSKLPNLTARFYNFLLIATPGKDKRYSVTVVTVQKMVVRS